MTSATMALATLLEALTGKIRAAGKAEDYCSVTVQAGNMVNFDFGPESGCSGTAWVRLVSVTPSLEVGKNGCAQWLNYVIEVGMIGPAPGLDETLSEFSAPSDEDLFDAAMRQGDEMALMFEAIRSVDLEVSLGDWQPQGPEGGILGGAWTVTVPSA